MTAPPVGEEWCDHCNGEGWVTVHIAAGFHHPGGYGDQCCGWCEGRGTIPTVCERCRFAAPLDDDGLCTKCAEPGEQLTECRGDPLRGWAA